MSKYGSPCYLAMCLAVLLSLLAVAPAVSNGAFRISLGTFIAGSAPDTPWSHTYTPSLQWNYTTASVVAPDGSGYALAGTMSNGTGRYAWLLRTDMSGAAMWNRTYGSGTELGKSLIYCPAGGFVLAGIYIYRLYANGDVNWTLTSPTTEMGFWSLLECADGAFAFAGPGQDDDGFADFAAGAITRNGAPLWYYHWGNPLKAENTTALVECSDTGLAVVGTTRTGGTSGPDDIWLLRTTPSWSHLWNRTYGGSGDDSAHGGVIECSSDGFAICGNLADQVALLRTDANGALTWSKTYGAGVGVAFVQCSTGGFAVLAQMSNGLYLIRTNANGDTLWTRQLHSSAWGDSLVETSGAFVVGGSVGYGSTGNRAPWLMWTPDEVPLPPWPIPGFHPSVILLGILLAVSAALLVRTRRRR